MTEAADTLEGALLAFNVAATDLKLKKSASGGHGKYLPLDEAMAQIRPLLATHGLYAQHYTGCDDGKWYVGTRIVHAASGRFVESGPFPLVPGQANAQGWGGALTYGRRYTLMEVLALVGDDDDDAAGAGRRAPARARAAGGKITAAQRHELVEAARLAGVATGDVKPILVRVADVERSADVPADKFDDVLAAIQAEKA